MRLPAKVAASEEDNKLALDLIDAAIRLWGAAVVTFDDDTRRGLNRVLGGCAVEFRVRLLPHPYIQCILTTLDDEDRELFALALPDTIVKLESIN